MSHVVPDLVQKILKGQDPLHILGDGNQIRHYTYGGDLATRHRHRDGAPGRAQRRLQPLDRRVDHRAGAGRGDLAARSRVPTCRSATCPTTPFEYDVQRRVPATDKAEKVLGFEATTSLDEMLDEVIPWIENAIDEGKI